MNTRQRNSGARWIGRSALVGGLVALGCTGAAEDPAPNNSGSGGTGATGGTVTAGVGGGAGTAAGAGGGAGTGGARAAGAATGGAGTSGIAGAGAGGAAGDSAGASGSGGVSGSAGSAGASGAAGAAGAGAGAAGTAGSAGASAGAAGSAGAGGAAGAAGSSGASGSAGSGGGGGAMNCKGNALSLSSNVAGGSDPAKSRVMVDFMQSTDLPLGNSNRTVEFWAYVLSSSWAGENNTIFEYGDQSTANAGYGLDFGGQNATMDPYTNGSCDNDNQASGLMESPDQWVHYAMTYDGTNVRLYVNGVAHSTKACTMLATARTQLSIGGNPRGSYFNGTLDEFRVWSVARTAQEITATMNVTLSGNETGLTAYYKFNDADGSTTAVDSVTTGGHTAHDGVLMATMTTQRPTFIPSDAPVNCP